MSGGPEVDVKMFGSIFSGAIYGQMKRVLTEIEEKIADEVIDSVQGIDDRTFVNPTGHARSQVRKVRSRGVITVDRSHLVYGPWLEGTSRRNAETRFKGYHAFERTIRVVQPMVADIANDAVASHLIR